VCDGASEEERARWKLSPAQEYHYLNQSTCFQLSGVDNAKEFQVGVLIISLIIITIQRDDSQRNLSPRNRNPSPAQKIG